LWTFLKIVLITEQVIVITGLAKKLIFMHMFAINTYFRMWLSLSF